MSQYALGETTSMNGPPSLRFLLNLRPSLQGMLFGLAVGALLIGADQASMHFGLKESQRVLDDVCGGVIAGVLVFWYARAKNRYITQQLNTIALMNHHIRNALQVITYAGYRQTDIEQVQLVKGAVERIHWALREVLPGRVVDYETDWKRPVEAELGLDPGKRKIASD